MLENDSHLKNNINKLSAVHLISSERFNKSATLDIRSNLIKYISGDGQYKLINGNIGLVITITTKRKRFIGIFLNPFGT
jgi:hypothetical protein